MTLYRKTLITIVVAFACLITISYATSRIILLKNYTALEERNTRQEVERTVAYLSNELSDLDATTSDWAAWDDTYAFIADANEKYIETNLTEETFINLRLNLIVLINPSGQIVFGKGFDFHNQKEIPTPQSLKEHFSKNSPLLHHPNTKSSITGTILLAEDTLLIAARPILTSKRGGPSRGTLVMGRYLDSSEIERLRRVMLVSLTLFRINDPQMPSDFQAARSLLSGEQSVIVRPLNKTSIAGYFLIKDIYRRPILVLRVDAPRDIYNQGRDTIFYFILSILAVGVIFGLVTMFILERLILSRVAGLSKKVANIATCGDFSDRVSLTGSDELSNLSIAINGMLDALEQTINERAKSAEELKKAYQELKETQNQLINSAKMASIGTLAAGISHEINNPLTIILGFCQLLLDEVKPDSETFDDLKKIEKHTRNCKRIVENLLHFARSSEIEIREVDISKGVRDALDLVGNQFSLQNIKIQEESDPVIPPIKADYNRLQQVFLNLLNNAGQAMPQGGILTVKTSYMEKENKVSIQIADTGEGIRGEDLPRIFDPFFTTRSQIGGVGLGLSVSQGIIESHRGEIYCTSRCAEENGQGFSGTTFTVLLPAHFPNNQSFLAKE